MLLSQCIRLPTLFTQLHTKKSSRNFYGKLHAATRDLSPETNHTTLCVVNKLHCHFSLIVNSLSYFSHCFRVSFGPLEKSEIGTLVRECSYIKRKNHTITRWQAQAFMRGIQLSTCSSFLRFLLDYILSAPRSYQMQISESRR